MLGIQEEERKSMYFQCRKYSKDMLIFIVADIWNCYNGYEEKDKLKIQGETKMIVFWIIGILFLIVGLIVSVPNLIKFIKSKEYTTGKIVSIDSYQMEMPEQYMNISYLAANIQIKQTGLHNIYFILMESVMLFMIRIIQIILISG